MSAIIQDRHGQGFMSNSLLLASVDACSNVIFGIGYLTLS